MAKHERDIGEPLRRALAARGKALSEREAHGLTVSLLRLVSLGVVFPDPPGTRLHEDFCEASEEGGGA